ncbi:MAG: peroxiredoxin family protein [bacterium]
MNLKNDLELKMALMTILLSFLSFTSPSLPSTRGILNQKAPAWKVKEWLNLPAGKPSLEITDFKGKVIYLYCFQAWCPGCHAHGFPTLQEVIREFKDDPDVAIIAVQTTFEGFAHNGLKQAREVAKRYSLDIPVGQSGTRREHSKLMASYRNGGTPWTIIIDKEGIVRYNDFHIAPANAIKVIQRLK